MNSGNKETCPKCNHEFTWTEWGGGYPGGNDKESVNCPYCGETTRTIMSGGNISTKRLGE